MENTKTKKKGLSNLRVAEELRIDRKTVAKYWKEYNQSLNKLLSEQPDADIRELQSEIVTKPRYDISSRGPVKYTKEIDALLDSIFESEEEKSKKLGSHKQSLTLKQIYKIIKSYGHDIGYSTLCVW